MPTDSLQNLIRNLRIANASLAQSAAELHTLDHGPLVPFVLKWQDDIAKLLTAALANDLASHPVRGAKKPGTQPETGGPPHSAPAKQPPQPKPPAMPPGSHIV